MPKLNELVRDLILYFNTDIQNLTTFKNQAIQMKKQYEFDLKLTKPENFQMLNDNISKLQTNIIYMANRLKEAQNYIRILKIIFSNTTLSNDISRVLKESEF